MLALKLAYKNILGAGLRTLLNVSVLSLAFVLIVFYNAMIDGWNRQGKIDTQEWEIGEGQFWHPDYNKFDIYSYREANQEIDANVQQLIDQNEVLPVLIQQATIYPQGRMQSIVLRGIPADQQLLKLPTKGLNMQEGICPAIIGKRMAKSTKLKTNDKVLLRWRDINGTYDAIELRIDTIFKCDVADVDNGQIYIDYHVMQKLMGMKNCATLLVSSNSELKDLDGWNYRSTDVLLKDLNDLTNSEKISGMVIQSILLMIALLAIFDTQVLSIFRRKREIGTYIALGLTRKQVVGIFTVEGGFHSILAAIVGAIYGIPLFIWINQTGLSIGEADMGITVAEVIYPFYSLQLILISIVLVVLSSTIVSYIPAHKIVKMKPTDALKGK